MSHRSRARSFMEHEVTKKLSEKVKAESSKASALSQSKAKTSQSKSITRVSFNKRRSRSVSKRASDRKSNSKRHSYVWKEPLPCAFHHTRLPDEDEQPHDFENPKAPWIYKPPFRRNFRYFGYPRDLNPDLNTPPRVRSWGPLPEPTPRVRPARTPYYCKPEEGLDPYWPGRLLKNSTRLENPMLLPVMGKAVQNLGRKPVTLVKPDLQLTNCVSQMYFPLSEASRKAFCRINKIAKEDMVKRIRDFEVQNPTHQKKSISQKTVRRSEGKFRRKSVLEVEAMKKRKSHHFSMINLERQTADIVYYEKANVPEILKVFCIPDSYPGINQQQYGRPSDDAGKAEAKMISSDDDFLPKIGIHDVYQQFSVPEDLWEKLAKVRARKQQQERVRTQKKRGVDKDFKTFTQLEMRNEVLDEAKRNFVHRLNRDANTPLPPELFEDNRDKFQPPHDYMGGDEFPAQGPFWWKTRPEEPPTDEESFIIDRYIENLKETHNYTRQLPGLIYVSRHPFPVLELDWFEKGAEMGTFDPNERRKTPRTLHAMPSHYAEMDEDNFEREFNQALKEKAEDLVGPEIYALYKKHKGIVSRKASHTEMGGADEGEEETKVKKKVRVRKVKPKKVEEEEEEEEEAEEKEEETEEKKEEEEEGGDEEEDKDDVTPPIPEEEVSEYNLEYDLENEEDFPLPDVPLEQIEVPKDEVPKVLDPREAEIYQRALTLMEWAEPIRKSEEELVGSDKDSGSTTDSELDLDEPEPELGHDPTEHLQAMYQEAIKAKYRNTRHVITAQEMKPPDLKEIFLENTFVDDIENLLVQNPNIPSFLQLF